MRKKVKNHTGKIQSVRAGENFFIPGWEKLGWA